MIGKAPGGAEFRLFEDFEEYKSIPQSFGGRVQDCPVCQQEQSVYKLVLSHSQRVKLLGKDWLCNACLTRFATLELSRLIARSKRL